jgi:hypothetical protein
LKDLIRASAAAQAKQAPSWGGTSDTQLFWIFVNENNFYRCK